MRESPLRLNDKTVILYGPGHSLTQATGAFLAEQGADVAFVGPEAGSMRKFAENLMDNRQIHPSYGRSASFEVKMSSEKEDLDAISKVAETFGGLEIIIDTHLDHFSDNAHSQCRKRVAQSALKFLEGRQRGRIIFFTSLFEVSDAEKFKLEKLSTAGLDQILDEVKKPEIDKSITVNALQVGVTEDFLLTHFKSHPLKVSIEKLKENYPSFHLVEPLEVAAMASFIASPISAGLCKQRIQLDKGLVT